jgi:hypothetical protein
MGVVLGAMMASAVSTIVITAKLRKEIMDYVDKVCDLNIEQVNKVKELSIKTVEELVNLINNKHE